jgi:hypothetical protein
VQLILGTNKQPSEPKLTNTQLKLARLADCATPVRPVAEPVKPVATAAAQTNVPKSLNEEEPFTKPSKTPPNQTRTDQHQHDPKTHESSKSPKTNPTEGSHWSDRSKAPVRPVVPGQLGMNRTRGSTPPNPTPDLPIRSTKSNKTLRIVGTPHGHSIAKLWSTKTCWIKKNLRISAKNTTNP